MRKARKIIGVCGSYLFNQQPIQFINQLQEEGLKYGYCITALSCGSDSVEDTNETINDCELISLIRHIPLSGLVVLTSTIRNPSVKAQILKVCTEKRIPVFSIDSELDGCYNMLMNHSTGFEEMIRHVIEYHGCRRINMLAGFKNNSFSDERITAYKRVLTEYNIPVEEARIAYADFWERPAIQAVRDFLSSDLPMPEAIVCANDAMALAAYATLQEAGYRVPEDIILTGYDSIRSSQYHFPVLTTCQPDFAEAVSFIIREIEGFLQTHCFVPCEHTIGMIPNIQQSCGCKPKTIHNMNHVFSNMYANTSDSTWHNITMNRLITDNLYHDNIHDLVKLLPKHLHMWKEHFRFACIKNSMLSSCDIPNSFTDLISIMDIRSNEYMLPCRTFPMEDFIPDIDNIENTNILVVRLLNSGKEVYGYSVEGFDAIDERKVQRCDEFAFFLSYCLNTIMHNAKQKQLADGLLKANKEISLISLQDSMTGLLNRRGFHQAMEQLLKNELHIGKYLYVFSIDMNRLKYINDTFGHAEGDFAISTLANAIRTVASDTAICSRFGGDEFVVACLHDSSDADSPHAFSKRLFTAIANTKEVNQKPYTIEASIGMCYQPFSASLNIENMLTIADEHMYEMKKGTKR